MSAPDSINGLRRLGLAVAERPDTTTTWKRLDAACQAALKQAPDEREAWVRSQYADDPTLRDALIELLASESASARLFEEALRERDAIATAALDETNGFDLVGTQLGPYRIESLVATGGMGAVYRANRDDGEFQQTVAIKILPAWATDANTVARLRVERQILSALNHPNITHLLDGGQTGDGFPYLVTEYIDGLSISEYAKQNKLALDERADLFLAVADAVQYAHEQGVVHRDIKPANVLVDNRGHPHLLDFGIAKLKEGVLDPVTGMRTATGFAPMTPEYASPEQLAGGEVGIASDVYQLGLLLYQLVTGERLSLQEVDVPGSVTRPSLAVRRTVNAKTPAQGLDTARLARELKGDMDTIVLKALRSEPGERYRSARALARDLRHYRAGEAIEAKPERLWSASRRLARHYPAAAALAVSLVLVLAIWGASLSIYARALEQQRDDAEREATRSAQIRDVLIDVFRRSDPLQADAIGGKDASVWASLDAAAAEARVTLADDPDVLAELLGTLSVLQRYAGEQARMKALLEESVALYAALGKEYLPQYTVQAAELALQLTNSDMARAQGLRDDVRGLVPLIRQEHPLAASNVLIDIASIDFIFGDFEQSLVAADEILALVSAQPVTDWSLLIEAHFSRGKALTSLERFQEAAAALEKSLLLTRTHFGEDHSRLSGTLSALAILEGRLGNQDQSILWAEQLVEIMSGAYAPDYKGLLSAKNNLALAYGRVNRTGEALAMLRDVIQIRRGLNGPEGERDLALSLKNLASYLHYAGELEEARDVVLESRTMVDRHFPAGSPFRATPWFTLGLIELDQGQTGAAEAAFRETLGILEPVLSPGHVQIHITRCFLAETLRRGGDPVAAEALAQPAMAGINASESSNPYYQERCQETVDALGEKNPALTQNASSSQPAPD